MTFFNSYNIRNPINEKESFAVKNISLFTNIFYEQMDLTTEKEGEQVDDFPFIVSQSLYPPKATKTAMYTSPPRIRATTGFHIR